MFWKLYMGLCCHNNRLWHENAHHVNQPSTEVNFRMMFIRPTTTNVWILHVPGYTGMILGCPIFKKKPFVLMWTNKGFLWPGLGSIWYAQLPVLRTEFLNFLSGKDFNTIFRTLAFYWFIMVGWNYSPSKFWRVLIFSDKRIQEHRFWEHHLNGEIDADNTTHAHWFIGHYTRILAHIYGYIPTLTLFAFEHQLNRMCFNLVCVFFGCCISLIDWISDGINAFFSQNFLWIFLYIFDIFTRFSSE